VLLVVPLVLPLPLVVIPLMLFHLVVIPLGMIIKVEASFEEPFVVTQEPSVVVEVPFVVAVGVLTFIKLVVVVKLLV